MTELQCPICESTRGFDCVDADGCFGDVRTVKCWDCAAEFNPTTPPIGRMISQKIFDLVSELPSYTTVDDFESVQHEQVSPINPDIILLKSLNRKAYFERQNVLALKEQFPDTPLELGPCRDGTNCILMGRICGTRSRFLLLAPIELEFGKRVFGEGLNSEAQEKGVCLSV